MRTLVASCRAPRERPRWSIRCRCRADAGLISPDGRTALVPVELTATVDADRPISAGRLIDHVNAVDLPAGATANVTGEWAVWSDFNAENEHALHLAELLSGLPTVILLFIAFGSAVAAGLPLLLAVAGIFVGWAALHLLTSGTPLSVWSMNFSMMIGLAVGIDYSLFIVSRYREEREDGYGPLDAIANTLTTAGKAVFLSALTVVLSLAAVFLVPVMVFRSMALGMILAVIATAAASLTLLPAVLVALGDRVLVAKDKDPDRAAEGRWARWTGAALRRPGRTLAAGLALLLVLAGPALGMRLGMPGARVVDTGRSSRDGYDLVTAAFGPGAAAPIFITAPAGEAQAVIATASADPNVADARIAAPPAADGRVAIRVTPKTAVDDPRTSDLVGRLRAQLHARRALRPGGRPRGAEPRPHRRPHPTAPLAVAVIMASRSCSCSSCSAASPSPCRRCSSTCSAWPPASGSPPSSSNTDGAPVSSGSSRKASSTLGHHCSSSPCSSDSRWTTSSSCWPPSRSATRQPATPARPCAKGSPEPAGPSPTPRSS